MEIKAFREKEAKDIVCILVGPSLPGLMRLREINQSIKVFFQLPEFRKL